MDLTHLDLHAMRKTCNTALLRGGVNPAIIRARLGHSSANMTKLYTDAEALDQGGHTEAVAGLLGMPGDGAVKPDAAAGGQMPGQVTPPGVDGAGPLRPGPELLAALVERWPNTVVGRILGVSEAAVRKRLRAAGIERPRHLVLHKEPPEWQIVLLRADLRAAMAREADAESRQDGDAAAAG